MCIIAVQPKGKKISKKTLRNCWDNNNDGAGLMYSVNGEIIVKKELHSFDKFMQYKLEADKHNVNIVLHFRISTSGGVNLLNCHPFKVNNNLHFCHNGMLDIIVPKNSTINDTQIYNNTILRNLPKNWQRNNAILKLVEQSIGSRNKFVLLDELGMYYIINHEAGVWDNDCWFSNTSYQYSYSNVITSNYYSKVKTTKKTFSYWDELETWHEETPKIENECSGCRMKKSVDEIVYSRHWDAYLCEECNNTFI
jgi:predicted glutamine amidotransferase